MTTIIHHHHEDRLELPAGVYWTAGLALAFLVLALLYFAAKARTDIALLAPPFIEPPLLPPIIQFLPLM